MPSARRDGYAWPPRLELSPTATAPQSSRGPGGWCAASAQMLRERSLRWTRDRCDCRRLAGSSRRSLWPPRRRTRRQVVRASWRRRRHPREAGPTSRDIAWWTSSHLLGSLHTSLLRWMVSCCWRRASRMTATARLGPGSTPAKVAWRWSWCPRHRTEGRSGRAAGSSAALSLRGSWGCPWARAWSRARVVAPSGSFRDCTARAPSEPSSPSTTRPFSAPSSSQGCSG
mmetsp:Transcript_80153/g.225260  ORF Transcript_80153/g.225260 Transcript_80153/m.225260 type:complete len:228 (-) Transcript_80153:1142-1825(-)